MGLILDHNKGVIPMKMLKRLTTISVSVAALLSCPQQVAAQAAATDRLNSEFPGQLFVRDRCILSDISRAVPPSAMGRPEAALPLLGTLAAGLVGDLARGALNGLANAIKRASQEHAYTAVGSDGYLAGEIIRVPSGSSSTYRFDAENKCLIFTLPASDAQRTIAGFDTFLTESGAPATPAERAEMRTNLQSLGLQVGDSARAPTVYVEVAMIPMDEGTILRPMLVWYGAPLGGAGTRARPSELVVELATPASGTGATTLGSLFSVARLTLPSMAPGNDPLVFSELENRVAALFYPNRPETGFVADQIKGLTAAETAVTTAQISQITAFNGVNKAVRDLALQSTDANRNALAAACETAAGSVANVNNAILARSQLREGVMPGNSGNAAAFVLNHSACLASGPQAIAPQAESPRVMPQPDATPPPVADTGTLGATNARVSFVVVKDANAYGMALATAISAQADAVDTQITQRLTPQADWAQPDTALVTGLVAVQEKQTAYSLAVSGGVPATIAAAHLALLNAKASANQAAAAVGQPLPFPGLMAEVEALLAAAD